MIEESKGCLLTSISESILFLFQTYYSREAHDFTYLCTCPRFLVQILFSVTVRLELAIMQLTITCIFLSHLQHNQSYCFASQVGLFFLIFNSLDQQQKKGSSLMAYSWMEQNGMLEKMLSKNHQPSKDSLHCPRFISYLSRLPFRNFLYFNGSSFLVKGVVDFRGEGKGINFKFSYFLVYIYKEISTKPCCVFSLKMLS